MEDYLIDCSSDIDDINKTIDDIKDKSSLNLIFKYNSDFSNAYKMRRIVENFFVKLGFSWKWKTRFIMISDELNNNAIEYWTIKHENNIMAITVNREWKDLIVDMSVEDKGNGNFPKNATDMEELRKVKTKENIMNSDSIRWRWLFLIISQMVDDLYFKDSSKWWLVVWITQKLVKWTDF